MVYSIKVEYISHYITQNIFSRYGRNVMLNLIENFKEKARKLNKTIVLPEGEEPRVIRAAEK